MKRAGRKKETSEELQEMPLLSHLVELRKYVVISLVGLVAGFALSLALYDYILEFLFKPLLVLSPSADGNVLYVNSFAEGFLVRLKISALAAVILSSPLHLYNILRFVFPGLLTREKRILCITLVCSFLCILVSFFYSYYSILPVTITFLTSKGFIPENTGMLLNFGGNLFYILQFMFSALIVFQMPIILELFLILDFVKRKTLLAVGRYVIVLCFLVAAIITPPDFITQISLALPMTVFYYLTILVAKIFKFGEA
jgi:sec-independent protein translocase protein TatC